MVIGLTVGLPGALLLAPIRARRLVTAIGTAGVAVTFATAATILQLDAL